MIKIMYTPPLMLYSYTESKQNMLSTLSYALTLRASIDMPFYISTIMFFYLSTKYRLHVFKISLHSPYKSEKETWAICYEKKRVEKKRAGKDDEKRER